MEENLSYKVLNIFSPLLVCKVPLQIKESLNTVYPSFKLEVVIRNDLEIDIMFGIKLTSDDLSSEDLADENSFVVVVEMIGKYEVSRPIPQIKKVIDYNLLPNLLASLFPFSRERVATLLGSSSIQYFLESFNAVAFIEEFNDSIEVVDYRKTKTSKK